jgi:hypothetical protein
MNDQRIGERKSHPRVNLDPKIRLSEILTKTKVDDNGCVVWLGALSGDKRWKCRYPVARYRGKQYRGNRLVWMLNHGDIPKGLQVLHSCDNSLCLNIEHLRLGTPKENVADAYARKRRSNPKRAKRMVSHG